MQRPPGVPRPAPGGNDVGTVWQVVLGRARRLAPWLRNRFTDLHGGPCTTRASDNRARELPAASGAQPFDGGLVGGFAAEKLLAVAVAGTVVLAAAGGALYLSGEDRKALDLEDVPAGVDAVAYVDADRMAEDPAIERAVDGALGVAEVETVPSDYEALLGAFENETGLERDELRTVLAYAKYGNATVRDTPDYAGALLRSEWERTAVVSALEDDRNASYEAGSYRDATVYRPVDGDNRSDRTWLGVLAPGIYAVGTPAAVEDAVDVAASKTDSVGGEVATAFQEARGGYAKVASKVPTVAVVVGGVPLVGAVATGPRAAQEAVGAA
ncbi:MAG: hypothetical protein V5A33_06860, partial [Halobacteriales archaeon]